MSIGLDEILRGAGADIVHVPPDGSICSAVTDTGAALLIADEQSDEVIAAAHLASPTLTVVRCSATKQTMRISSGSHREAVVPNTVETLVDVLRSLERDSAD
jgi:hypothetical protein